jgi:hypothetical protein
MIALFESLLGQTVPTFGTVDRFSSLECNIEVTTLDSQIKACVLVFDEVKCDLSSCLVAIL